ncbi:hypothetical protein [Paenibacillus sp. NPDC057934]|uniref:hypothetical protein n=1 Tax=Paenibacillus sp. NPDC057934 TaxID=3346282 RepID=UPI0036DCE49B
MGRLKFEMWKTPNEERALTFAFTDGKGLRCEWTFFGPPESISHVGPEYLKDRLPNVKTDRHVVFIKKQYSLEMKRRMAEEGSSKP